MNEKKKTVSVIIPCYNAEKYIKKTLATLESQTYSNIQVLLIDDGSIDNTKSILEEYKRKSRFEVIIISQKNQGVSKARNRGIDQASGDYIIFLDSDDVIASIYIEILLKNTRTDRAACCYFTREIDSVNELEYDSIEVKQFFQNEMIGRIMHRTPPINFLNLMFERKILNEYGIRFSTCFRYGEDNEFMWKYVSHFEVFNFIDAPLYGYRENAFSAMNRKTDRITESVEAIRKAIEHIEGYGNYEVSQKLRDYLIPRTKIAVAKEFAKQADYKNFALFCTSQYGVDDYQKMMQYGNGINEKIANFLLYRNKIMFYMFIRMTYKMNLEHLVARR